MLRKRTLGDKGEGTIWIECVSDVASETHRITETMPLVTVSADGETIINMHYRQSFGVAVPASTDITITYSGVTYFNAPQTKIVRVNRDESKTVTATYVWQNPKVTLTINVLSSNSSYQSQLNNKAVLNVTYPGFNKNYTYKGSALKLQIPLDKTVRITPSAVTNFNTPSATSVVCDTNKTQTIRYIYNPPKLKLYTKRFFPAGNYTWTVPNGCTSVDVFLVGGGAGGDTTGGGGGYTKTFKKSSNGWRDGGAISVSPGQHIPIVVGAGGNGGYRGGDGEYSEFLNSNYRAYGGKHGYTSGNHYGGDGGSGGGAYGDGGYDGNDGYTNYSTSDDCVRGYGQGHTTRDFGESNGKRNAGGGSGQNTRGVQPEGGYSDYTEGSGGDGVNYASGYAGRGGGGYGGGGGAGRGGGDHGAGGDGTVLIRYYAY